ncbi:MAG: HD domain-containing phosphohydrolase [Thermodesulfobacteriota bacterium]
MDKYIDLFREMPLPAVVLGRDLHEEDRNHAFERDFVQAGMREVVFAALSDDILHFRLGAARTSILEKSIALAGEDVKTFRVRLSRMPSLGSGCVLALFTDITERKKHLEEMSRLASIVDNSDDAILSLSPEIKILSWNDGAAKIFGYCGDTVLLSSAMKLFPESAAGAVSALFRRVLAGESFVRHETVCCHDDGHLFPVSMTLSPLRDHAGISGVTMIARDISSRRHAEEQLLASHHQLRNLMHETVESLSTAHEKRDLYTAGHQRTVSMLGCIVADEMNLSHDQMEGVRIAGLLHDIGKVCLPMAILSKPAALSPEEMALVKRHPQAGYEIVRNIPFTWPVKETILQHHERMDGSGYPHGLRGEKIGVEARILAAADVLEAMSSHRPYRPALGLNAALEELRRFEGVRYDPDVCRAVSRLAEGGALRIDGGRLACKV